MKQTSLKLTEVSYQVGGKSRIKELSLAISAGKKIALLGLNGAGKSTLIRLLVGEISPSSGEVEYCFNKQPIFPYDLSFKNHLGYQADTMLAIAELTGLAYLRLCGSFKQVGKQLLEKQIVQIAKLWKIADILHLPLASLSKGNLQKLSIVQAFLGKPQWLFFDEPCQSLDPVEQLRFNQNIADLEQFECCLVSTHNVDHALEIADEILLFHQGQLVHHFSLDEKLKILMVLKTIPAEQIEEMTQSLIDLGVQVESRFQGIFSLTPKENTTSDVLLNFAEQWEIAIEFLLPEKQALMPLFRLLASGEVNLDCEQYMQVNSVGA